MAEATGEAASAGALLVAERLLGAVREEISRADSKASILLSGAVAVLAVLAAGPQGAVGHGPLVVLGAVAWCAGIVLLVLGVLPRTRPSTGHASLSVLQAGTDVERLGPAVREAGGDPGRWLLEQACDLGVILHAKYRCVRAAMACLAVAAALVALGRW